MDLDTEQEAPAEAAPSRREAIEAAFDQVEASEAAPTPAPSPSATEPTPAPETTEPAPARTAAEKARDEAGRFAKAAKARAAAVVKPAVAPTVTKRPELGAKPVAAAPVAPAPVEQLKPDAAQALKAPASWKPAARERWASLPAEVQQEAVRRERETQAALQESSEARKNWTSFQQAVAPYEGMIRAEGGEPVAAAASLFQTAAALRTAPAPAKARIVANLCRTYGIDIQMLDNELAGQGPQQGPAQHQHQGGQQQFRDPRFDELMSRLQSGEQQRKQAVAQQTAKEVQDFGSTAEFFDDVRQDMADLLEVAARRGVALTIADAYNRAVKLHPEVSEVLSQREKAKAATATMATTQRSRAAATSVKSRPAGPAPTQAPNGRRGALEAAWDAHDR